ncbi:MAG: divalent metal cation transporter [Balneolaceae bacterium]
MIPETGNKELELLKEAEGKPFRARFRTYLKLSGPGFLQSALSLGGGSMASSLYLGVLTGYSMLWLQPIGMLLGIIMLSALGYITIVTGERPFRAINRHVNPVLGWAWALAALLASIVWAMPQFSLANGVMQQNLFPGLLGERGAMGGIAAMVVVSAAMLAVTYSVTWNYNRDHAGVVFYEWLLKGVVAVIVLSFAGVVIRLSFLTGSIDWGELARGFIPNPALIFRPAEGFLPLLEGLSGVSRAYWTELIVNRQQNVMAAALSSAVGINMTFLFAYSMLRRKWSAEYRGLMKFDLLFGMLIPFMLVTSFVIIAGTSQFHTVPQPGIIEEVPSELEPAADQVNEYNRLLRNRVLYKMGPGSMADSEITAALEELGREDRLLAATLITRDAFDLSSSLDPLLGSGYSRIIFGIGVLGMALSSITLMMIISGFVVCEMMGRPYTGWEFRAGALLPGLGVLGPFFWDQAFFWLAIPTSVITLLLLPVAYVTFLLMMNNRALMGEFMPKGRGRVIWNSLMVLAVTLITSTSLYMLWMNGGFWGLGVLTLFLLIVGVAGWIKKMRQP